MKQEIRNEKITSQNSRIGMLGVGLVVLIACRVRSNGTDQDLYSVAEAFADLLADGLGDADDVADIPVDILDTHIDHTAAIGYAVEGGLYLQAPLAVFLADVDGHYHVCGVHVAAALDCGFELMLHINVSC